MVTQSLHQEESNMVTIKRVDITSAMKVAALINALSFTVLGILFFALNSLLIGSITTSISTFGNQSSTAFNPSAFAAAGLATCGIGYLIGVVFAALFGAIIGALYAFFYNVIANWAGGLRIEIVSDQPVMTEKRKYPGNEDEFRF
jgi:hypothetical protein